MAVAGAAALTFSIKAIATAALRYQENALRYKSGASNTSAEARLQRIEQAVEAIAVEVERLSEGQRFTTKLLSERPARLKQPDDLA